MGLYKTSNFSIFTFISVISLIHVRFLSCVISLIHVRFLSCVIIVIVDVAVAVLGCFA